MSEAERKELLFGMTGGLRCRCPGFTRMVQVRCKGVDGLRMCLFACEHPDGLVTEFPVGEPGLCRCALGMKAEADPSFHEDEEGVWGMQTCMEARPPTPEDLVKERERRSQRTVQMLSLMAGSTVIAGMLWAVTR